MKSEISLPEELLRAVDEVIRNSKLGYNNRYEFIVEAVRDRVYKSKTSGLNKRFLPFQH